MTLEDQGGRGALVLAAHGSRTLPTANATVRRLAQSIRARRLFDEVAVAFHQGEPRFDGVLDELASNRVTVVPLLSSEGHYTKVVLPEALARNRRFGEIRLRQTPPIGTHPRIAALVARRVTQLLRDAGLSRQSVALVIAGHGTRRHQGSRTAALELADTLRRRRVAGEVLAAFIDDDPGLEVVVREIGERESNVERQESVPESKFHSRGPSTIVVVPFLLGGGAHVLKDIPDILQTGDQRGLTNSRLSTLDSRLLIDQPIGDYPGLDEIVIDLARRHAPSSPPNLGRRNGTRIPGSVHLVGAGPGDPGLLTVRGLELLCEADVVIYDRLIGREVLDLVRPSARLVDAGKAPGHSAYTQVEINQLLVSHAKRGARVVRLKGGDPFVFGRGSEEVEACTSAGVSVEVVPGISSALAAPAAAGIPVTARGIARSFTVITGTEASPCAASDLSAPGDTLVILMGRSNLGELARQLISEGRDPATPAACIQSATTAEQRVTRATLATIASAADQDGLVSPVVTVIGQVAAMGSDVEIVRSVSSAEPVASTA